MASVLLIWFSYSMCYVRYIWNYKTELKISVDLGFFKGGRVLQQSETKPSVKIADDENHF